MRAIRALEASRGAYGPRVFGLTANALEADVLEFKEAGCDEVGRVRRRRAAGGREVGGGVAVAVVAEPMPASRHPTARVLQVFTKPLALELLKPYLARYNIAPPPKA